MQNAQAQHRRKLLLSLCDRATVNSLVRVGVRDELMVIVRVRDEVRVRRL